MSVSQILFFLCSGKAAQTWHILGQAHLLVIPESPLVSQQPNGCHFLPSLSGVAQRVSLLCHFPLEMTEFVPRNRILSLVDFIPWNIILVNKCLWYIFNIVLKICVSLSLYFWLIIKYLWNYWLCIFWAPEMLLIMFTNTSSYFPSMRILIAAHITVTFKMPMKAITSWFKIQRQFLMTISGVRHTVPLKPLGHLWDTTREGVHRVCSVLQLTL